MSGGTDIHVYPTGDISYGFSADSPFTRRPRVHRTRPHRPGDAEGARVTAITSTGITCPSCGHTLCVQLDTVGQQRQDNGTVRILLHADISTARTHIESHES